MEAEPSDNAQKLGGEVVDGTEVANAGGGAASGGADGDAIVDDATVVAPDLVGQDGGVGVVERVRGGGGRGDR